LEQHLPHGKPGKPRVDDRRVISGILHVLKVGCRWRDVPPEYGPAKTVYNCYHRWSQRRIWQRMFETMAASGPVPEELSIDSTHVKAHRSAQGLKGAKIGDNGKKPFVSREAEERAKYIVWPMIAADRSLSP
jgi:transposase